MSCPALRAEYPARSALYRRPLSRRRIVRQRRGRTEARPRRGRHGRYSPARIVQWIVDAFGEVRPSDAQGQRAGCGAYLRPFAIVTDLRAYSACVRAGEGAGTEPAAPEGGGRGQHQAATA